MDSPLSETSSGTTSVLSKAIAAITLTLIAAWLVWFAIVDPTSMPGWFQCPFRVTTGLYCPGCGSTRATHHLLNGDLGTAFRHNPMLILLGIPALVATVWVCIRTLRNNPRPILPSAAWLAWLLLVVILGYGVLRNIPIGLFEPLRPPHAASHQHTASDAE